MEKQNDPRLESLKNVKDNTPQTFSMAELCGMDEDSEDAYIDARRDRERESRW
jgi:hypothetical protein